MAESITITDNRTGESVEVPIVDGGVDAAAWRKLLPGVWFYDPAFTTTAVTSSAITDLDGEAGILRYRGYPIEQLAEHSTYLEVAYLLIHGELPTPDAVRRRGSTTSRTTRSSTRTCASGSWRASTTTPTRWGCSCPPSPRCRPSTPTPRRSTTRRTGTSRSSGSSPRCPRWPPRATASAWACRSCTRTTRSGFTANFLVDALEDRGAALRRQPVAGPGPRRAVHPPRRPRAELLHHRDAHGRLGPRRPVRRAPPRPPPPSTARATAAPTRP